MDFQVKMEEPNWEDMTWEELVEVWEEFEEEKERRERGKAEYG